MSTKKKKKEKLPKVAAKGVYAEPGGTYYTKYKNDTKRGHKSVADAKLYIATQKLKDGELAEADLTFDVLAEAFIDYEYQRYKEFAITYGTYKEKERIYRLHLKNNAKNFNFKNMTSLKMRKIRTRIFNLDLSTSHKNNILAQMKLILEHGRRYYGIKEDYSIFLENFSITPEEKKKSRNRLDYVWTEEDFSKFITQVRYENRKVIYTLFFKHGLRIGEARALFWNSIDVDKCTLTIDGSMTRKTETKKDTRVETKTDGSNRTIFIGKNTMNLLLEYKKSREVLYGFSDDWYIFGDQHGTMSEKMINNERIHAIKQAGIPYSTNHDMRHMFVSNAWSSVPITALSKYIGHKNVSVTLDYYSHLAVQDNDIMTDYIANFT